MAQFEGIKWASLQMRYLLPTKNTDLLAPDATVFAVSRSLHYGLFLAFEGIRFFCHRNEQGKLEVVFLNWGQNLERFRRGISFNLGREQQHLVPTSSELENLFITFFREPALREFFLEMAELKAQGYLRPFTVDEEQSIGVTFPSQPSVRAVMCRYDQYLGEPFEGVVIPTMVRAIGANKTGCLKLGTNYLISVKAIDLARSIHPKAASALFLDDDPAANLFDRLITEWDSSCCLIALTNGTVIKIPESDLILPSVTIKGIVALLKQSGIRVEERNFSYGELHDRVNALEITAICSVGTAGILNRCSRLVLVDNTLRPIAEHVPARDHELYGLLGSLKKRYWELFQGISTLPEGLVLNRYELD